MVAGAGADDASVNTVAVPRQGVVEVKSATGSASMTTDWLVVFVQLLMLVTVNCTVWGPAVTKVCAGCCSVDVLFVPDAGSPKFHNQVVMAPPPLD